MFLLNYEQPAWSWCFQTLQGCEDRGLAIGVLPTTVEFKTEEGPVYLFWKHFSFDVCKGCLLGEFNGKVFLFGFYFWVNIARKYIGKHYFYESLADVLWACSGGAAGVKMSEIPCCALQRAKIWCDQLWQCSCYLPSCFLFGGGFPGIPALVPK